VWDSNAVCWVEGASLTLLSIFLTHRNGKAHYAQCPTEDVTCPHCDTVLARGDLSNHTSTCPELVVSCDQAMYGCPWTGPRRTLSSSHLPQCPYEAVKGFFALNVSRISALETENSSLRWRVEELENDLRGRTRDLQMVKQALGPWFRPDGCHVPLRPSPPSGPAPRSYPRRRFSNALNSAMFGFSQESASSADPAIADPTLRPPSGMTSDAFAQFFPPSDDPPHQPPHPSENFLPTGQMADGTYPRTAPNSQVAPLNLDTTLEGSLLSLRSSIVTLAASLDSEGRRHDIALTTETLRVNEEVMALRAIVHGLRMQVHQIMMDRNSQVTGREDDEGVGYNYSHVRPAMAVEPWTSSVRYLNHHPPVHRPISIGTTTHIQTTKL
jgi:TRAF-type zinc finger